MLRREIVLDSGVHLGGGRYCSEAPPHTQKSKFKKKNFFVDKILLEVLRDLCFS